MATFDETLSDGIGFSEAELFTATTESVADTVTVVALLDVLRRTAIELSDGVDLALTEVTHRGVIITEPLSVADGLLGAWLANMTLTDSLAATGTLRAALPAQLSDEAVFAGTLESLRAVALIDTVGLAPVLTGNAIRGASFADTLQVVDTVARFVGLSLADTLSLAETVAALRTTWGALTDTVAVADSMTPQLALRAVLQDGVEITEAQAIQSIFSGVLIDGVELTAAYVAPDGAFTTWAINTRSAAVSEYTGYEFNSFARIGNRYIGASETGLYWLDGDDDDGEDIIARLKGGFLQFGGTRLSRLKAAYIATRGEDDFILRIEEGSGAIYDYAVSTRDVRSTKVRMGKGQRARYFAWELTSSGGDFDLDTLEFVPIVVQRRV